MEMSGSTAAAVGRRVLGVAAPGAEIAALSSDEQEVTNMSRSKTAGQKMLRGQDGKIKFKKCSSGNVHSSAVVMEYYE